nr:MAG TPA: hypothetical protein [Caudoviricetes sp.]
MVNVGNARFLIAYISLLLNSVVPFTLFFNDS